MTAQAIEEEQTYLTLARQAAARIDARNREEEQLAKAKPPEPSRRGRKSLTEERLKALCVMLAGYPEGVWYNVTGSMLNQALPDNLRFRSHIEGNKLINLADSMGLLTQQMNSRRAGRAEIRLTPAGYELAAIAPAPPQ